MLRKLVALLAVVTAAWGAPPASPKNSRIALRYENGRVLIVGGDINISDEAASKTLAPIHEKYPKLNNTDMAFGASINEVPPELLQGLQVDPKTDWHIGDPWQLYPGAGPPATVVIEKIVILSHRGCGCFRDGAIARFLTPTTANRIEGLRAAEFLVVPGAGLANVSQTAIIPLSLYTDMDEKIRTILFRRAREVITDENWGIIENPNVTKEELARIKELNRGFLSAPEYSIQIRAARWTIPGRKPLLFVLALWYAEVGGKSLPVFAGEAILEEGDPLNILSFEYREGDWMRFSEFSNWTWDFDSLARYLNAWKIGDRYFVLRYQNGYESGGVALQELDFKQGLLRTDLGYAFGD